MKVTVNTMKAWAMDARLATSIAIPTDLDAIAEMLNVAIIESDELPPDVLGAHAVHPEGHSVVAIKTDLSYGCRRFTVAHEICHHLIDRVQQNQGKKIVSVPGHYIERMCNQFAAELLMPVPDVEHYAPQYAYGLEPAQLKQLAEFFQVTTSAMQVRLRELRIPVWWWEQHESATTLRDIYAGVFCALST